MGEMSGRIEVLADPTALARHVAEWMTTAALVATGAFRVSLSGGSTPKTLYTLLASEAFSERVPMAPGLLVLGRRALRSPRSSRYIGLGEKFDGEKVKPYPPGSVIVLPGNTPHFHWAKSGEYVTQVSAIGPLGLECLDPTDDPRRQHLHRSG